jgi:hypothetical protein
MPGSTSKGIPTPPDLYLFNPVTVNRSPGTIHTELYSKITVCKCSLTNLDLELYSLLYQLIKRIQWRLCSR